MSGLFRKRRKIKEKTVTITEEEFAERIGSPSFHIFNDGDFEAAYGDDDMFYVDE